MLPASQSPSHPSPKCKKENSKHRPTVPTISTSYIARPQETKIRREEEDAGGYSPRDIVAGRLGNLAIFGDNLPRSPCNDAASPAGVEAWAWAHGNPENVNYTFNHHPGSESQLLVTESSTEDEPASSARTSMKSSQKSINNQRTAKSDSKRRRRRASPPLSSNLTGNSLTWHYSEITGHNPSDPNDDGYGINGIGFKPTVAVAWARSRRRQQQVADWKSREAREARDRRRERREGVVHDKVRENAVQKRVKFSI